MDAAPTRLVYRFATYEADPATGELRKSGVRLRLPEQPFRVLIMLLERPGDLVTREEIRQKLWPADTFVDFDHSLNTAVKKLRQALGDDRKKPRFIETLPKRGYRFIGTVKGAAVRPAEKTAAVATASSRIGQVAKLRCEEGTTITLLAVDETTAKEREKLQAAGDDVGISMLIATQKLLMVERDTPLRILEVHEELARCQVRILEGEHYGKTALLPMKLLAQTERASPSA